MKTVKACATCTSTNLHAEHMTLVTGQEGSPPQEIVMTTCLDCGDESHATLSS